MTRQSTRALTPSRMLADKLSENEIELKSRLVQARINAAMSVEDVARKLGVEPAIIEGFEASDADLLFSELRHYAYAINALVHFDVAENWTARISATTASADKSLFVGEVEPDSEPSGHWSDEVGSAVWSDEFDSPVALELFHAVWANALKRSGNAGDQVFRVELHGESLL